MKSMAALLLYTLQYCISFSSYFYLVDSRRYSGFSAETKLSLTLQTANILQTSCRQSSHLKIKVIDCPSKPRMEEVFVEHS